VQSLEANIQYTDIIDISTQRDVTVEVDWGQSRHYCPVSTPSAGQNFYSNTAIASTSLESNGVLGVYVFNDLATPNSVVNNDIQVNVYVSLVDAQVASPAELPQMATLYSATVQAGEEGEMTNMTGNEPGCGPAVSDITMGAAKDDANEFTVYFGERIASFRQLLHRYNFYTSISTANTAPTAPANFNVVLPQVPMPYGYNAFTLHTTTVGAKKFNYVSQTMLQYLMPAFACVRGSHRAKLVAGASSADAINSLSANRITSAALTAANLFGLSLTTPSIYGRAVYASRPNFNVGGAVTVAGKQPALEIEFPYQKAVRFDEARIVDVTSTAATSPYLVKFYANTVLSAVNVPVTIDYYTSVGEDFQLFWFQGCPPLVLLTPPA